MNKQENKPKAVLPTGVIALDLALGTGGLPLGEIIEIYGQTSSGKTTLALHTTAEAQALGLNCLYLDLEGGITLTYARRCGVSPEKTLFGSPEHGEDALELAYLALKGGSVRLVVLDTVAALCPRRHHSHPAATPAGRELNELLIPALRRLKRICREQQASLICLNQLRSRLKKGYGHPETSPGGMVLKIQAAVRIRLDRMPAPNQAEHSSGERILARIQKNQRGVNHSAFFNIVYNMGIDREKELISLGLKEKIIHRVGSQIMYGERLLGRDPAEIQDLLRRDRKLRQTLRSMLYQKMLSSQQR